jgi:hypothetical protein
MSPAETCESKNIINAIEKSGEVPTEEKTTNRKVRTGTANEGNDGKSQKQDVKAWKAVVGVITYVRLQVRIRKKKKCADRCSGTGKGGMRGHHRIAYDWRYG